MSGVSNRISISESIIREIQLGNGCIIKLGILNNNYEWLSYLVNFG